MADEEKRVRIVFEAVGGAAAADDAERLKEALGGVEQQAGATEGETAELRATIESLTARLAQLEAANDGAAAKTRSLEQAFQAQVQKAIQVTQGIAGAAGAVAGLAGALGGGGGALQQGADLVSKVAASTAAFAQLGMQLGPQGAIVGGIVGALIPAISSLIEANDQLSESARIAAEEQSRLDEISQRMSAERQAQVRREIESGRILTLSQAEITRARLLAEADLQDAVSERDALEARYANATGDRARRAQEDVAEYDARIRALITTIGNLGEAEGRLASPLATRGQSAPVVRQRRSGGGGGGDDGQAEIQRRLMAAYEEQQRAAERLNAIEQRRLDLIAEQTELRERLARREEERSRALWTAQRQEERERLDAIRDQNARKEQETLRAQTQQYQAELERRTSDIQKFTDIAGSVSGSLVTAISEITSGAKTAEEAFKGLLASFLSSIAERALVEALAEYAAAAGAFARYDFGSGAAHVGAGILWTGVAVATGAAAGAVSAPPAQPQADSPDRASRDQGSGGRVTYVTNWNAPVVAAGTYAEVGRTVNRTTDASERRFGRLAA